MPTFSKVSKDRLATCDRRLQEIFNYVITQRDCTVLCGIRGKEDQEKAFAEGNTKVHYPNSRHNSAPSQAVDVMPCPLNWADIDKDPMNFATVAHFAGFVKGVAAKMGYRLTWGGDWNGNGALEKGDCWDMPHFQIED